MSTSNSWLTSQIIKWAERKINGKTLFVYMFFWKWDFFFRQRSISDWDIPLYFPISSSLCWGGAQHYAFLLWATTAVSFTMNKFFKVVDVKREAAVILYMYIVCTYILCGAKLKIRRTHMRASKIDIFQKTTCFNTLKNYYLNLPH